MLQFHGEYHGDAFNRLVQGAKRRLWIVSPFITRDAVIRMRPVLRQSIDLRLITRLNRGDLGTGILDAHAILELMEGGAVVRFADASLHAKVWIIDDTAAIGSVNLTGGGFVTNIESMVYARLSDFCGAAPDAWFMQLWQNLEAGGVRDAAFVEALARDYVGGRPSFAGFGEDFGGTLRPRPAPQASPSGHGAGRQAWLLLGHDEMRLPGDTELGDVYAQFRAGWGFSKGAGTPRLDGGDRVYFVESSRTTTRPRDRRLVGRAIVDVPYTPGIGDIPEYLKTELSETGWTRANQWNALIWLRNVEIMHGTIDEAPSMYDILPERDNRARSVKTRASSDEERILDAVLEERFGRLGVSRPRDPQMWWGRYALNGERYTLATVAQRLNTNSIAYDT